VARQTRAERRARRQQAAGQGEPALAGAGGGPGGKPPVALAPQPPSRPEPSRREGEQQKRRNPFASFWRFLTECWGELRKTEWPSQNHVIQGTIVVLVACVIMGTFIWVADIAFKHLVQDVLLR
jgi:preprotein translocase subunit SecE